MNIESTVFPIPPLCGICNKKAENPRMRAFNEKFNNIVIRICSEKCLQEYVKTLECFKEMSKTLISPNKPKDFQVVDMEDIQI